MKRLVVGVLALQGDFQKHKQMLEALHVEAIEVRKPEDLNRCDALILPGGESTSILLQMRFIGLDSALVEYATKKPIFGTCAGLILLAKNVREDVMKPLGILDIEVERNAYGRQNDSFKCPISIQLGQQKLSSEAIFIRAPRIHSWGPDVEILATYEKQPILIRQGKHFAATFHPELTNNQILYRHFLSL